MKLKPPGYVLLLLTAGTALLGALAPAYAADKKPNILAIRVGDWKAIYRENRAHRLDVWREPFVHLRLPLLFNLRRDPFEKSQHNSNTYHDWMIDRAFVLVPLQALASQFLLIMKDYPPSQTPGDWSLDTLEKQIKGMTAPRQ